jgi:hypothetical protein
MSISPLIAARIIVGISISRYRSLLSLFEELSLIVSELISDAFTKMFMIGLRLYVSDMCLTTGKLPDKIAV